MVLMDIIPLGGKPVPEEAAPDLVAAIHRLSKTSVLVVGDVMLDRYAYGDVTRISPEAPVPILTVARETAMPGGAGNVVRNLTALGAAVAFIAVVGDDQAGSDLTGLVGGQPGVEPWLLVQSGRATTVKTRYIANVSGSTVEEYVEVTRLFDDSPIDAIEINISCPNVKEGGVQFGNSPEMSARVVAACRKATKKPIITKLSPNQTDIALNARLCIEAGTDGFAVINTLTGMAIDTRTGKPVIGNRQGGLSGPAIKPIALLKTAQVSATRNSTKPRWPTMISRTDSGEAVMPK